MTDFNFDVSDEFLDAVLKDKVLNVAMKWAAIVNIAPMAIRVIIAKAMGHNILGWIKNGGWDTGQVRGALTWFLSTIFELGDDDWAPWPMDPPVVPPT